MKSLFFHRVVWLLGLVVAGWTILATPDSVSAQIESPVVISSEGLIRDYDGSMMTGNQRLGPAGSSLVHILGSSIDGIKPPAEDGSPHEDNTLLRTSFVGERTAYSREQPSLFAAEVRDAGIVGGIYFIRVYDAPTTEKATRYLDSEELETSGRYNVTVSFTSLWKTISSEHPLVLIRLNAEELEQVYTGEPREVSAWAEYYGVEADAPAPTGLDVILSYDGQPEAPIDAGKYVVTGLLASAGYVYNPAVATLTVARATQTLVFPKARDEELAGKVKLTASAGSGQPVVFEVVAGPAELQDDDMLVFTGEGEVYVKAEQEGDANRLPVSETNRYDIVRLSVLTAHGSPVPIAGDRLLQAGSVVTNVMPQSVLVEGLTRYRLHGYAADGFEGREIAANIIAGDITNTATLTWLWETNFWLGVGAGTHGSVDKQPDWHLAESEVSVSAEADIYYTFDRWLGVAGEEAEGETVALTMNEPRKVWALFRERLTDTGGVPEWWLAGLGYTNDFDAAAMDDVDGDRVPNWEEFVAGTDATNKESFFYAELDGVSAEGMALSWPSEDGRIYQIEYTTNLLSGEWDVLVGEIEATPPLNEYFIAAGAAPADARTFRATVQQQEAGELVYLVYSAGPNGSISGDAYQVVALGGTGTQVEAVPDEGYVFARWSDGATSNPRQDGNVKENVTPAAIFIPDAE